MAREYEAETVRWEIWYADPQGNNRALVDKTSGFTIVKGLYDEQFKLVLPGDFERSRLVRDARFEFWRAPTQTAKLAQVMVGLFRVSETATDRNGLTTITAMGPGPTELTKRRIVAYPAGATEASGNGPADDLMKAIARENLGALAAASRDLSGLGFTVQGDMGDAPTVERSFSWQNVYPVLVKLADSAWGAGTRTGFHIVPVSRGNFEFRTWTGQPGQSRLGVVFSLENNNLERPKLRFDYSEEETHIYAGGSGEGADRNVREVSDDIASEASVWNLREGFADCRMETEDAGVDAAGEARLAEKKPRVFFKGRLIDSDAALFGRDWGWGDFVSINYGGVQLPVLVQAIKIVMDRNGKEKIDARVRYDG